MYESPITYNVVMNRLVSPLLRKIDDPVGMSVRGVTSNPNIETIVIESSKKSGIAKFAAGMGIKLIKTTEGYYFFEGFLNKAA